jgi:hypothetical protein
MRLIFFWLCCSCLGGGGGIRLRLLNATPVLRSACTRPPLPVKSVQSIPNRCFKSGLRAWPWCECLGQRLFVGRVMSSAAGLGQVWSESAIVQVSGSDRTGSSRAGIEDFACVSLGRAVRAVRANAHISESRYGAPGCLLSKVICGSLSEGSKRSAYCGQTDSLHLSQYSFGFGKFVDRPPGRPK